MSHFVDQFRLRFDVDRQLIYLSVCITEQRTIEHLLPVLDMYRMVQSFRKNEVYSGLYLKTKYRNDDVIMTIQVSPLTRRSYNFNQSQFAKLIGLFRGTVAEEQIDTDIEIIDVSDSTSSQSESNVTTEQQHFHGIDELSNLVTELKHALFKMNVKIEQIFERLESTPSDTIVSYQPQETVFEEHISDEMPMFIPSTVKTEFEGKIETTKAKATDDNIESASNLLKQLKKGRKK